MVACHAMIDGESCDEFRNLLATDAVAARLSAQQTAMPPHSSFGTEDDEDRCIGASGGTLPVGAGAVTSLPLFFRICTGIAIISTICHHPHTTQEHDCCAPKPIRLS